MSWIWYLLGVVLLVGGGITIYLSMVTRDRIVASTLPVETYSWNNVSPARIRSAFTGPEVERVPDPLAPGDSRMKKVRRLKDEIQQKIKKRLPDGITDRLRNHGSYGWGLKEVTETRTGRMRATWFSPTFRAKTPELHVEVNPADLEFVFDIQGTHTNPDGSDREKSYREIMEEGKPYPLHRLASAMNRKIMQVTEKVITEKMRELENFPAYEVPIVVHGGGGTATAMVTGILEQRLSELDVRHEIKTKENRLRVHLPVLSPTLKRNIRQVLSGREQNVRMTLINQIASADDQGRLPANPEQNDRWKPVPGRFLPSVPDEQNGWIKLASEPYISSSKLSTPRWIDSDPGGVVHFGIRPFSHGDLMNKLGKENNRGFVVLVDKKVMGIAVRDIEDRISDTGFNVPSVGPLFPIIASDSLPPDIRLEVGSFEPVSRKNRK